MTSAATAPSHQPGSLTAADLEKLKRSYIPADLAARASITRVENTEGAEIVGRKANSHGSYAGLLFPYYWPGKKDPREYRLRRDRPPLEQQSDGSTKERDKYLSPPGRSNLLYFPPDTFPEWLLDTSIPAVITEGEKKALALWQMFAELDRRALVIALPGVWNWRGTIGKTTDDEGHRREVKGTIPDLERITWAEREVVICFDANVRTNEKVAAARRELAKELDRREARVMLVDLPEEHGVNGVNDLLGIKGRDYVIALFKQAKAFQRGYSPPPVLTMEEKLARRRALGVSLAPETAQLISGVTDVVSFVLRALECPPALDPFVRAVVGAANGNWDDFFPASDWIIGKRMGAEVDLSDGTETEDEKPTTLVTPVQISSIKKRAQRSRKKYLDWHKLSGLTMIEIIEGDQIDDQNIPTRYRVPVGQICALAFEEAKLRPEWCANMGLAAQRAAREVVRRERLSLINPPKRQWRWKPGPKPESFKKAAVTNARKFYESFKGVTAERALDELVSEIEKIRDFHNS